jgi:hypothetical protein
MHLPGGTALRQVTIERPGGSRWLVKTVRVASSKSARSRISMGPWRSLRLSSDRHRGWPRRRPGVVTSTLLFPPPSQSGGVATALQSFAKQDEILACVERWSMHARIAAHFAKLWSARGKATALGGWKTVKLAMRSTVPLHIIAAPR